MNLLQSILDLLGGNLLNGLSAKLGMSEEETEGAVKAVVPVLLASLLGRSDRSDSSDRVVDAVRDADDGILDDLGGWLGGEGIDQTTERGGDLLASVLGSSAFAALAGILARFFGVERSTVKTLLGFLTPIVLSAIKRRLSGATDINAGALTQLFDDQKDNILGAVPSKLAGLLYDEAEIGDLGLRESFDASMMSKTGNPARDSRSRLFTLILLALPVIAIAGVVNYLMREKPEVNEATPRDPATARPEVIKMTNIVANMFGSLESSLDTISDATSAEAALPSLRRTVATIESIGSLIIGLPEDEQSSVRDLVVSSRTSLLPILDRLLDNPEISAIVKPTIDEILDRLQELAPTV